MKKEKVIEILWFVILIFIFILSIRLIKSGELESQLAQFGVFAPLALVLLKASTLIIAPLGGTPLYVIGGAVFGTYKAFFLTFLGDVFGSVVCFLLSRRYGERIINTLAGEKYTLESRKIVGLLDSTRGFLKARVTLLSIPEILAYAAGLSRISFLKFVILHCLFYIPVDFVLVFFGSQIADLSGKYLALLYGVIWLITVVGFVSLYKDYDKSGDK